jgi:hypothetical protein
VDSEINNVVTVVDKPVVFICKSLHPSALTALNDTNLGFLTKNGSSVGQTEDSLMLTRSQKNQLKLALMEGRDMKHHVVSRTQNWAKGCM